MSNIANRSLVGAITICIASTTLSPIAWATSNDELPTLSIGPHAPNRQLTLDELNDIFQIQQIMASYSRASDRRDGKALACLVTADYRGEFLWNDAGILKDTGRLLNREAIFHMFDGAKRSPGTWSQHSISDPLIELHGDTATADYRFLKVLSQAEPNSAEIVQKAGFDQGSAGISFGVSGHWQAEFRKVDGVWKIARGRTLLDLPPGRNEGKSHKVAYPPMTLHCPE